MLQLTGSVALILVFIRFIIRFILIFNIHLLSFVCLFKLLHVKHSQFRRMSGNNWRKIVTKSYKTFCAVVFQFLVN